MIRGVALILLLCAGGFFLGWGLAVLLSSLSTEPSSNQQHEILVASIESFQADTESLQPDIESLHADIESLHADLASIQDGVQALLDRMTVEDTKSEIDSLGTCTEGSFVVSQTSETEVLWTPVKVCGQDISILQAGEPRVEIIPRTREK